MKNKMLLAALAVVGSLGALTGLAAAWDCPPAVCGAGNEVEQIVGGIDIMPDPIQRIVRNGGRTLDQTTTDTWNDHVDPTLTSVGDQVPTVAPQIPSSRDLMSVVTQAADEAADGASTKAAVVVAVAQHAADEVLGAQTVALTPLRTDEHQLPSIGFSGRDALQESDR